MKLIASVVVACVTISHSLALVTATNGTSPDFTSSDQSNASHPVRRALWNTDCVPPANSVTGNWRYGVMGTPHTGCTFDHDTVPWIMLNAYRTGGGSAYWRYVSDEADLVNCLKDWTYYGSDGQWVIAKIQGYTTTLGDKRKKPWCPLLRYQPKSGRQGYQWEYCQCYDPAWSDLPVSNTSSTSK
jgi:hypothetical protein